MDNNTLEPRIKDELECLNSTSETINLLENEISEKRNNYRSALTDTTQRLNHLAQKLGDCVPKARPYYEARRLAKQAQNETQQAALNYERAVSMHVAAREMVTVAEQGMLKDINRQDSAWPEMLNHATIKVNEAEVERFSSELEHQQKADAFKEAERAVHKLEKKLRSNIKKSRPYFDTKQQTQKILEDISDQVAAVEKKLKNMKVKYSLALQNLEAISDSIHASRNSFPDEDQRMFLGERQEGVGAENIPSLEQIPEIRISQDADGVSIDSSIVNDLKKIDSTEHLNEMFHSTSLDDVSLASGGSQSSFQSATFSKEGTVAVPRPITSRSVSLSELAGQKQQSASSNNTDPSRSSSFTEKRSRNGTPDLSKHSPNSKTDTRPPSRNSNSSPSNSPGQRPNQSSSEVVLSIAGLGEVLSS